VGSRDFSRSDGSRCSSCRQEESLRAIGGILGFTQDDNLVQDDILTDLGNTVSI
jgi:hypothetical protein